MDGAEKSIQKVAEQTLPTQPHHLCLSFGKRFPQSKGWWYHDLSVPLQYTTYISAGQRGVLLTRAAFEIVDEPQQPMATKPLASKGEVKKKMSLMDYKNKKKSASPVENGTLGAAGPIKNGALPKKPLPPRIDITTEEATAVQKPGASRLAGHSVEKSRPETNGNRRKPPQVNIQAEIDSRKRPADSDGIKSPPKRAKPGISTTRPEHPRQAASKPSRDTKSELLHPRANGLAPSSMDKDREATASPKSTILVNASRPRSDSGTSTPRKPEPLPKSGLPMLLSPLNPSLFESAPKKKLPEKSAKSEKADDGPSASKKGKNPIRIPPLLSPTLPPVVEEAFAAKDRKLTSSKTVPNQASGQTSDSSNNARKTIVAAPPIRVIDEEEKPSRPSKIVTLKFKKAAVKRVKELLSLPSKSAKDALKKERATSIEPNPPPAKKRPRSADDVPQDTIPAKRPKPTADVITAKLPPRPTTPLKPAAASMSRVASSQSQGATPGATTAGVTPARPPTTAPNPLRTLDPKTLAQAELYRDRHTEYTRLGSKLKHARDDLVRLAAGGNPHNLSPTEERRAAALHFEMVLAYMVAFHSLNAMRLLERRACDVAAWETLLPHFSELRTRVAGFRPLRVMATQVYALCLEQITNGFATLDPAAAAGGFARWTRHNRTRAGVWGRRIRCIRR
ncbi:hypothetical protein N0V88_000418 [Collariella sp. IMI 366227]|nr:hypothetical protein N0V88_000418 [Collariella sp. IMI 366227]